MNASVFRRFFLRSTQLLMKCSPAAENVLNETDRIPFAVLQRKTFSTSTNFSKYQRQSDHKAAEPVAVEDNLVYREVHEKTEGDTLVVEASYTKPGDNFVDVENPHGACPICSRNLKITYKDVLILSQFIDEEGNLLPRDLTGVCAKQQLHLRECIERALAADLLPDHIPSHLRQAPEKEKGKAEFHRF